MIPDETLYNWQVEADEARGYGTWEAYLSDMVSALISEVRELRAERDAVIEAVRAIHSQDESLLAAGAWCPVDGDETPCRTLRAAREAMVR